MWVNLVQGLVVGLLIGGVYALVSLGLTLIYGVLKVVNFAHGEFLMIAMYATYWLWALLGLDPILSAVLTMPLLYVGGVYFYKVIIKPLLKPPDPARARFIPDPHLSQIFMTLGLSVVMQNVVLFLWRADYRSVVTSYSVSTIRAGPILISFPKLLAFIACMVLMVLFMIFMLKTDTGKAIRATTQNTEVAQLMGINVQRMFGMAFGIGMAFLAAAGAFIVPFLYVFPTVGFHFALMAFIIVVLGGYGSIRGAVLGGLIIGISESMGVQIFVANAQFFLPFLIFILVLLFRPEGLFGGGRL